MTTIFVFTQNLKLDSFENFNKDIIGAENVVVTSNFLFENERKYLRQILKNVDFVTFSELLSDSDECEIDYKAYNHEKKNHDKYILLIKIIKNKMLVKKIREQYNDYRGFLLSNENDLGLYDYEWIQNGFKKLDCNYYYSIKTSRNIRSIMSQITIAKKMYHALKRIVGREQDKFELDDVHVSEYQGKKYIFLGKMHRIAYRLSIEFSTSEEECKKLNKGHFYEGSDCQYLTTWHEQEKCKVPDNPRYDVRWMQDGYLPPNYTHDDYAFKPQNVSYYAWDVMGEQLFFNKQLPVSIIPFRKKLYIPSPIFPKKVENVLFVASGAGDWTALKNRSDDDLLVESAAILAKRYPNINFVYRCHPTWVHPQIAGVNSIKRVSDYFAVLKLPNLILSSNIPIASSNGGFQLSFLRSSLESDLENADLVFGEHSISMIDGAFKRIPFSSVNLTNRRNFFVSISELGFPHCTSVGEMEKIINSITSLDFQKQYCKAIENYNKMTDEE